MRHGKRAELIAGRKAAGMTGIQVAEALDIAEWRVYAIERGRGPASAVEMAGFARVYGSTVNELFPGESLEAVDMGLDHQPAPLQQAK